MKNYRLTFLKKLSFPLLIISMAAFLPQMLFAQKASFSTSDLFRISDNSVVEGAQSQLVRNPNGLTLTIHTSDLPPGAYTVWWVIENYPQYCTERPCSSADEANPLVQTSVFNATGHVVGNTGAGNFGAWIGIGGPYSGEVLFGPGLLNPLGADVYLVVRYHGPVIPGMIKEQTTTFDGGCSINTCSDEQIAFHISS